MFGISLPLLIISGLTAYILSSWMLVFLRVVGATRFAPRSYWACTLFGSLRGGAMLGGRIARAAVMSVIAPTIYALIFELVGNAELTLGAVLGIAHGVVVGITLPVISRRASCARAPSPGLFGWRLGAATPLLLLLVYALYGATLGWAYVVVAP